MKNLLIASTVLLLAACAKTPSLDYDKSADFSNYKTFSWVPNASLTENVVNYQISPLTEKRVREAVNAQLEKNGMKLVDMAQADVLLNYHASVDTKINVQTMNMGYNYWGVGHNTYTVTNEYDVGTLILDVVDKSSNQLVWRGAKEGRLKKKQSPQERTDAIVDTVADILSSFPPQKTDNT
ncbi:MULTISPECIES: DUF4136 domain-containing protein [Pseudoalteromonas]|jgi:hypothetical protein|uniref:DUF4136 domain-containing protein n=1 Tax=Pseudoalteromonas TaxID=53246 RepID=UPI0018F70C0E|nr:DUF4136 domain-containing protein [Pseudoalteromonas sp. bablab_jr004]